MSERLVCGIHAVAKALTHSAGRVRRIYLQHDIGARRYARIRDDLLACGAPVERVDAGRLAALTGTPKHQGIAAAVEAAAPFREREAGDFLAGLDNPLVLVLDGVQDPRNFGACLRTADAAGADLVVTARSRNVGVTPAVSKVAAGAADVQPLAVVGNLARFLGVLKDTGIWVVGTDAQADNTIYDVELTGPVALVLGAEGTGLRRLTRDRCDCLARLPMAGSVESLNVAVAAGVGLYEAVRQRLAAPPGGR